MPRIQFPNPVETVDIEYEVTVESTAQGGYTLVPTYRLVPVVTSNPGGDGHEGPQPVVPPQMIGRWTFRNVNLLQFA